MEANRDDAQACCNIAEKAMLKNDYVKAIKLLRKANGMYPCSKFQNLLEECQKKLSKTRSTSPSTHQNDASNTSGRATSCNGGRGDATNNVATSEQERICLQVTQAKDYYSMLNVDRNASDDEIKRAYKKLALKLHPDKNPSPLASESFKKISTAFQCLTNPKTREHYDRFGEDAPAGVCTPPNDHFVTPDQLFEAFFGVSTVYNNSSFVRNVLFENQRSGRSASGNLRGISHLFPFIVMLSFIFFSNIFNRQTAVFQYHKSAKFNRMLSTNLNGVVYYVDARTFELRYPESSIQRLRLEYEVDYNYFDQRCTKERKENQYKAYSYLTSLKTPPKELYETPESCIVLGNLRRIYVDAMEGMERGSVR